MSVLNDAPQLLPQAALQQILDAALASQQLDKYKDNTGRLMWSCPWGGGPIITYYLYNAEGHIIEIGESWMNTGARFSLHCLRGLPAAHHLEFLSSRPRLDNVRHLAPNTVLPPVDTQPTQPVVAPAIAPPQVLVTPIPPGTGETAVWPAIPAPPQTNLYIAKRSAADLSVDISALHVGANGQLISVSVGASYLAISPPAAHIPACYTQPHNAPGPRHCSVPGILLAVGIEAPT